MERVVERVVEVQVPVERIVERIVEVDRPVPVPQPYRVEVPVPQPYPVENPMLVPPLSVSNLSIYSPHTHFHARTRARTHTNECMANFKVLNQAPTALTVSSIPSTSIFRAPAGNSEIVEQELYATAPLQGHGLISFERHHGLVHVRASSLTYMPSSFSLTQARFSAVLAPPATAVTRNCAVRAL